MTKEAADVVNTRINSEKKVKKKFSSFPKVLVIGKCTLNKLYLSLQECKLQFKI